MGEMFYMMFFFFRPTSGVGSHAGSRLNTSQQTSANITAQTLSNANSSFGKPLRAPEALTMYHCLEITEILEIIIEFAIQELGGRRTILSLSGTCRTLRGPSLDYYWRTQESLAPLLRFIPPRPCIEEIRRIGDISRTVRTNLITNAPYFDLLKFTVRRLG